MWRRKISASSSWRYLSILEEWLTSSESAWDRFWSAELASALSMSGQPAKSHAKARSRDDMTEPERVWGAYIEAWNTHEIDSVIAAVGDQFVYDDSPMTMAAPLKGRQSFAEYLKRVFEV